MHCGVPLYFTSAGNFGIGVGCWGNMILTYMREVTWSKSPSNVFCYKKYGDFFGELVQPLPPMMTLRPGDTTLVLVSSTYHNSHNNVKCHNKKHMNKFTHV